jgi:putative pyoverdin transport system ATP-binding/permease protein
MRMFYFILGYSRRMVVLATVAGVLSGAGNTALLALVNSLVHSGGGQRHALLWAFGVLCLVVPFSRVLSELLVIRLGQSAIYDLRMRMSEQILAVPLRRLEELGAPTLLSVLTGDIPMVTNAVTTMPGLCINLAVVAGCLIYLGTLSWKLLLILLLLIGVGIATYQLPVAIAMRYLLRARDMRDRLYGHFRALTEGSKELKLHFGRRREFLNRTLHETAMAYRRDQTSGQTIYTVAASWGQLLLFLMIGLLLLFAPGLADGGTTTVFGYVLVLLYLMTPLQVLMNALPLFGQAEVALQRIETLGLGLAEQATERTTEEPPVRRHWHKLELLGVTHVYHREGEDRDFVLGPIDLEIRPGRLLFLTGGNGSGKTSLAKLLVGLYSPQGGEIRLDGVPVTDENRESYRQLFAVVFSDFYLFDELLGLRSPQLDEASRAYLQELQIAHKVTIEDGRLSTTQLSQGQRKRLALLTAYLEDRPIYLFDEWAADQDPVFRELFYTRILPELKRRGKAVVAITHDESFYQLADEVVKLDSGKLKSVVPRESFEVTGAGAKV